MIAPEASSILSRLANPPGFVERDQLDAFFLEALSPRIAVVTLVANQSCGFCCGQSRRWQLGTRIEASVFSASLTSTGEAGPKCFLKGIPLPSTTTIHFVPLPCWSCRPSASFRRAETAVDKGLALIQQSPPVQLPQQRSQNRQPHLLSFPVA